MRTVQDEIAWLSGISGEEGRPHGVLIFFVLFLDGNTQQRIFYPEVGTSQSSFAGIVRKGTRQATLAMCPSQYRRISSASVLGLLHRVHRRFHELPMAFACGVPIHFSSQPCSSSSHALDCHPPKSQAFRTCQQPREYCNQLFDVTCLFWPLIRATTVAMPHHKAHTKTWS